jgi:hypothetical protein
MSDLIICSNRRGQITLEPADYHPVDCHLATYLSWVSFGGDIKSHVSSLTSNANPAIPAWILLARETNTSLGTNRFGQLDGTTHNDFEIIVFGQTEAEALNAIIMVPGFMEVFMALIPVVNRVQHPVFIILQHYGSNAIWQPLLVTTPVLMAAERFERNFKI